MNSMFKNIQAKSTCPFTVFTWVCTLVILAVLAMAHPWKFCLNTFNMFCFPQHQLQALLRVDIVMLYLCMLTKHVHIFTSWLLAFVSFSVSLPTIFLHAHIATSRITGRSFLRSVSISFFLSFRSSSCTPNLSTKSIYIYISPVSLPPRNRAYNFSEQQGGGHSLQGAHEDIQAEEYE